MYNNTTRSERLEMSESLDSKYTVADILSSMASGDPLPPTFSGAAAPGATVSETTPLLTPTTLASIEQTFAELQSVPTTSSPATVEPQAYTRTTESGFVPPVINMVKQEYVDYSNDYGKIQTSDPEWLPPGHKRARMSVAPASAVLQSAITPVCISSAVTTTASAPVTPRRHTGPRPPRDDSSLSVDELRKRKIRRERNKQAAAKCRQRRVDLTNKLLAETEDLEDVKSSLENDIQNLQQQKEQLEFLLQAHKPLCHHMKKNGQAPVVKTEKPETTSNGCLAGGTVTSTVSTRPNTLPLPARTIVSRSPVTEATGVSITTPSNGVLFNFGLESMMDGHTGLTPLTGGPSCASQVHRSSSDSSPSDTLSSPTTLMAL